MSALLKPYKGYIGQVDVDIEAGIIHGRVVGLRDVISFSGVTVDEVNRSFWQAVDDYLAFCEKIGEKPEKSFSGKIAFRTQPQTHQEIALAAQIEEKSINTWMDEVLRAAASKRIAATVEQPAPHRPKELASPRA